MNAPAQSPRPLLPGRKLLLLQNPGRGSRNYLNGIISALRQLNIAHCVLQMSDIWSTNTTDPAGLVQRLSRVITQQKIGAVLGYGYNGMPDIPPDSGQTLRSFFEIRGIPHLMLWLDHPHWHSDLGGLSPSLQPMFRSGNNAHFLKSAAHALDMERIAGWPNCFELPAAVDPDQFPLHESTELAGGLGGEFDLVAICTDGGELPPAIKEFVTLEDPDPAAIRATLVPHVFAAFEKLWRDEVPEPLRPEVSEMGKKWIALKAAHPFFAAGRHWPLLAEEFPGACWFLTLSYQTWMKAVRILWNFREWERRFYLAYLARYFKVGVFGADWSKMGLGPVGGVNGGGWVDFLDQSKTYARGKVALNITDGHDEEGLTLKPFEIAASGIPMIHYFTPGLTDCFTENTEVQIFRTPKEAREKLTTLLNNPTQRKSQAAAARARILNEHTWSHRIEKMFTLARLPLQNFRATP